MKIFTRDSDIIPEFSAEYKTYEGVVDLIVLKDILDRTPSTSLLHLVVCPLLQDSYFQRKNRPWNESSCFDNFKDVAIVKVCLQNHLIQLQPLFLNSIPSVYSRLVIFFPFKAPGFVSESKSKKRQRA